MTTTPELDRAIGVAQERVFNNQERVVDPFDRTYARALIIELWRDFPPLVIHAPSMAVEIVRDEFLRRAGLEGEG